jgi:MFS family permease
MSHSRPDQNRKQRFTMNTVAAFERYRRFLRDRDATLLLGAGIVSAMGDWFNTIALIALAFNFGDGVMGVGGLLILRMLPRLILQGPAGTLVDRRPGRQLLITMELLMAVIAASFALLAIWPSLWLAYALVLALESANTVARPGFMVRLLAVVEPDQRPVANGLYAMGVTVAQFAGPLLGGLTLAWIGTTPLFLVNGVTFLLVAVVVFKVRQHRRAVASPSEASRPTAVAPAGSYRSLLRRADVLGYIALTISAAALIQATIAFFILRAHDFGLGDAGTGPFFAAAAVGFFIGGAIAGLGVYRSPRTLILVAAAEVVGFFALVGFGLAGTLVAALIVLVLAGIAADASEVPAISYFQHNLPEHVFGRFYALFTLSTAGGGLIGLLIGPFLEPRLGMPGTLSVIALPGLIGAAGLVIIAMKITPTQGSNFATSPTNEQRVWTTSPTHD